MPRFDFLCPTCHRIDQDVGVSVSDAAPNHRRVCSVCGEHMEKLPAAPNFHVKGYNAKSGYATK